MKTNLPVAGPNHRRFCYSVRTTEPGCCCVVTDTLNLIAHNVQGEHTGYCSIWSHVRVGAETLAMLEEKFKVKITLADMVVCHANWLLAVAETYPDSTIHQLARITSEREFAALLNT